MRLSPPSDRRRRRCRPHRGTGARRTRCPRADPDPARVVHRRRRLERDRQLPRERPDRWRGRGHDGPPGGTSYELYRGVASIPLAELIDGWTHVGDPDSADGYIIDAYQGSSSGNKKMFLLTTPSGSTYQYVHTLVSGELYNNSFDAISPDTRWMVSGEWGTMTHFQLYPTPY
jgi:hypothetical protein